MILTKLVEIRPLKNGTIYVKVLDGKDFTAEELLKIYAIFEDMANGKPYKVINDARGITVGHIDMEAFKVNSTKQHTPNQVAEAYLFDTLHIRLLINFYFKIFKPAIPSKMFETLEEAEKWLNRVEIEQLK